MCYAPAEDQRVYDTNLLESSFYVTCNRHSSVLKFFFIFIFIAVANSDFRVGWRWGLVGGGAIESGNGDIFFISMENVLDADDDENFIVSSLRHLTAVMKLKVTERGNS